jgi:hypothetical protein
MSAACSRPSEKLTLALAASGEISSYRVSLRELNMASWLLSFPQNRILLNGSDRGSNGKGVRAPMNAAFVALDRPLLSYHDPHTWKHGDLSPDEEQVKFAGSTRTSMSIWSGRQVTRSS